jgi:hypothetical protein
MENIVNSKMERKDLTFEELQRKNSNQSEQLRYLTAALKKCKDEKIVQNINSDLESVASPDHLKNQLVIYQKEIGETKTSYENLKIKHANQSEHVRNLVTALQKYKDQKIVQNNNLEIEIMNPEDLKKRLITYEKKIGETKIVYENLKIKHTNQSEVVLNLQTALKKYKDQKIILNNNLNLENLAKKELKKQLVIYEKEIGETKKLTKDYQKLLESHQEKNNQQAKLLDELNYAKNAAEKDLILIRSTLDRLLNEKQAEIQQIKNSKEKEIHKLKSGVGQLKNLRAELDIKNAQILSDKKKIENQRKECDQVNVKLSSQKQAQLRNLKAFSLKIENQQNECGQLTATISSQKQVIQIRDFNISDLKKIIENFKNRYSILIEKSSQLKKELIESKKISESLIIAHADELTKIAKKYETRLENEKKINLSLKSSLEQERLESSKLEMKLTETEQFLLDLTPQFGLNQIKANSVENSDKRYAYTDEEQELKILENEVISTIQFRGRHTV